MQALFDLQLGIRISQIHSKVPESQKSNKKDYDPYIQTFTPPWCRKHGEKHGIHGETMVSPCFPCFPCFSMLCKSMEKHGKHGNIFQVTPAEHGLAWNSWDRTFLSFRIAWKSMGSMEQHFLMISDSMGKHGEHGNSSFS